MALTRSRAMNFSLSRASRTVPGHALTAPQPDLPDQRGGQVEVIRAGGEIKRWPAHETERLIADFHDAFRVTGTPRVRNARTISHTSE